MEPKIVRKGAMAIAGISGRGDETGKVWNEFLELDKTNPLSSKDSEEGYEIRIYSGEKGPGEVHVTFIFMAPLSP